MPCTQDAPLLFAESDNNPQNRKRTCEAAYRMCCAVNRGTVQSRRTNEKYFTNPANIDFSHLISSLFLLKILAKLACSQRVYSSI